MGYEAADDSLLSDEYKKKVNPTGYVPALVVDGEVITENPAILTYLASSKPDRNLLGSNTIDQAKILEWLEWLSASLHGSGYGAYLRPERYADDETACEAVRSKGLKKIMECHGRIENRNLGKYAYGDQLTAVDVSLHVFFRWGIQLVGIDMAKHCPKWAVLAQEVERLQSMRDAMEEEGEALLFPHYAESLA